ncbi:MAG TPA: hypothetical protein VJ927_09190 [Actinomycetota bacterium]|nr:hypothetical protein [Actinomycetota bacterium]
MGWRRAATEKLKEIGETIASDVEALVGDLQVIPDPPTPAELRIDPPPEDAEPEQS